MSRFDIATAMISGINKHSYDFLATFLTLLPFLSVKECHKWALATWIYERRAEFNNFFCLNHISKTLQTIRYNLFKCMSHFFLRNGWYAHVHWNIPSGVYSSFLRSSMIIPSNQHWPTWNHFLCIQSRSTIRINTEKYYLINSGQWTFVFASSHSNFTLLLKESFMFMSSMSY